MAGILLELTFSFAIEARESLLWKQKDSCSGCAALCAVTSCLFSTCAIQVAIKRDEAIFNVICSVLCASRRKSPFTLAVWQAFLGTMKLGSPWLCVIWLDPLSFISVHSSSSAKQKVNSSCRIAYLSPGAHTH